MGMYVLKNSGTEVVIKAYTNLANGETITFNLSEAAENGETVTGLSFRELFWTTRPGKHVTVQRVEAEDDLEGGYYFSNVGHFHFNTFVDSTYSQYPIRFTFDAPGTVILRMYKTVA